MEFAVPLTELTWAFAMIAFYCEFSQIMCDEFDLFNEELQNLDWHLFSVDMQRIFLMFILDTQQSTVVRGYGNILCTRETFKEVT